MSVTTSKLEDYNTEIHNVLTSGAKLERVYEGDWSAIANELEKSEQESEILPIVLELFNIEIDDPEVRTNHRVLLGAGHHQADIRVS